MIFTANSFRRRFFSCCCCCHFCCCCCCWWFFFVFFCRIRQCFVHSRLFDTRHSWRTFIVFAVILFDLDKWVYFFVCQIKCNITKNSMVEQEARLKNLNFLRVRLYIYLVRSMILVEFIACDIFLSPLSQLGNYFSFRCEHIVCNGWTEKKKPAEDFEQCFLFQFKYFLLSFFILNLEHST